MNGMGHSHASVTVAACLALLAGCTMPGPRWPLARASGPAPAVAVNELLVAPVSGGAPQVVLQYRERNTLVLDLQEAAASGSVVLARRSGEEWPVRLALRMSPLRIGSVEVLGAQRLVLPVARGAGSGPVTVELPPGIHDATTGQLLVRWGAG